MKKFLLVILFLGLCRFCFADVISQIVGKELDSNGNIIIKTAYWIDGVNVESRYPKIVIKDKDNKDISVYYWVTRYQVQNFANMDKAQVTARIKQDLKAFSENLIVKPFQEEQVINLKTANVDFFNSDKFDTIVGEKETIKEAKMIIDKNFDGVQDTELTCKTDGSKIETVYTPPTP